MSAYTQIQHKAVINEMWVLMNLVPMSEQPQQHQQQKWQCQQENKKTNAIDTRNRWRKSFLFGVIFVKVYTNVCCCFSFHLLIGTAVPVLRLRFCVCCARVAKERPMNSQNQLYIEHLTAINSVR